MHVFANPVTNVHKWTVFQNAVTYESYFRKQNHVIEKVYAKPKSFGFKFHTGLRVKLLLLAYINIVRICMHVSQVLRNKLKGTHLWKK